MTTWFDDESGVETSRPREGFLFTFPGTISSVYRLASCDEDVTINGNRFLGAPRGTQIERESTPVANSSSGTRLVTVTLPLTHAIAQRYLRQGFPPAFVRVEIWRAQVLSGEAERIWLGEIEAADVEDHAIKFSIPSRLVSTLDRKMPRAVIGKRCPHVLYDAQCKVSESGSGPEGAHRASRFIAAIDGNQITVTTLGRADGWADFGMIRHVRSGEEITIFEQVGSVLTLQFPIVGAEVDDPIDVFAGCNHFLGTCGDKFENQDNFGGGHDTPKHNPHAVYSRHGIMMES